MTIPLFYPQRYKAEWLAELSKVFDSRWLGQGPLVDRFEEEFGRKFGYDYCLAVNSGSAALELAYHLIGIGNGDEVVTTVFTCTATNLPLLRRRAKIIFADIDDNLVMDYNDLCKKVSSKTKAIVVVTLGGLLIPSKIFILAAGLGIPVVIDAAQSLGVTEPFGDFICYSFQAIKHFTCFPTGTRVVCQPSKSGKGTGRGSSAHTKQIEKVVIGDMVLSFDHETHKKSYKKVLRTFEHPFSGELISLGLSNGNRLDLTEDHPVYIVGKGYVQSSEIVVGDEVIQYNYRNLTMRLNGLSQKGRTYEEIHGREKAQEIKKRQSECRIGNLHHFFGKPCSEDRKLKISCSEKGKVISEGTRKNMSNGTVKYWTEMSQEKRKAFGELMRSVQTEEIRIKKSETMKVVWTNPEYRQKQSLSLAAVQSTRQYWENYAKGRDMKPNRAERRLGKYIEEACPGEFQYNGDFSRKVVIGNKIPDFVNQRKAKVIELFGDYWHSEGRIGIPEKEHVMDRISHFRKNGYDCLVIWERELKDKESIQRRVSNFLYNPDAETVTVVSVDKIQYSGSVHNIEVEDNNNYFAYGVLVHNCGDGGMLVCRDQHDHERAKKLRWFGIDRDAKKRAGWNCSVNHQVAMEIEEVGYKFHMGDIAAALGLVGLKHTDEILEQRQALCRAYLERLPTWIKAVCGGSCWLFAILCEHHREGLIDFLRGQGIECDLVQLRNDIFKVFGGRRHDLPNMNRLEPQYLYLPLHGSLTPGDVNRIAGAIRLWAEEG